MGGSFCGWYLKCQSGDQTLAVIPAIHSIGRRRTCSIQIITEDGAWSIPFPVSSFRKEGDSIFISKNRFGKQGIRLAIRPPELNVRGKLSFGPLSPLKYDIMGPFSLVPFLECRHSVWSMKRSVSGRSFPKEYVWTQCCFPGGSLMLSVADIPMAGLHFNGVICFVLLGDSGLYATGQCALYRVIFQGYAPVLCSHRIS